MLTVVVYYVVRRTGEKAEGSSSLAVRGCWSGWRAVIAQEDKKTPGASECSTTVTSQDKPNSVE